MTSLPLKEQGNEAFKKRQYDEALSCYTKALDLSGDIKDTEKANLYKNRAMCYLKVNQHENAVNDATKGMFTVKILKIRAPEKFAVITLKFEQGDFTIE